MKIDRTAFIAALAFLACVITGCANVENYGASVSKEHIANIGDILRDPQQYDGKDVTVKGTISLECETGCWFNLKDGGAVIYVDVDPSGFAIPQKVGRTAIVEGNIRIENRRPVLVGRGVEIR